MDKKLTFIAFFIILISCSSSNVIKVAPLFSDGMVLQRNTKVDIWGTSIPNSNIKIQTEWGQDLAIKSDDIGNWTAKITTLDAGGPFYLKIISNKATKLQSGYIFDYAFVMLLGFSLLLTFFIIYQ